MNVAVCCACPQVAALISAAYWLAVPSPDTSPPWIATTPFLPGSTAMPGLDSGMSLRRPAARLSGIGVPLDDVQDGLGHADPRTTRRYDTAGPAPRACGRGKRSVRPS
jgi:hypothetical protein